MENNILKASDFAKIRVAGSVHHYRPGEIVFSEGEPANTVYFIESGKVSIYLHEFTNRVEIGQHGPGSLFGEMAVISQGKRTATVSAVEDTTMVVVSKEQFRQLMQSDGEVQAKVNRIIAQRTEELTLKENLLATTGIKGNSLQISIKGDPTLRETVYNRERRESPMDQVMDELKISLQTLLLERCVSELSLHFNSGEIRVTSIFDPFNYEIHPANKLIDGGYLDRHFPRLSYDRKTDLIRRVYGTLAAEFGNFSLPGFHRKMYQNLYQNWQALDREEIVRVVEKLPLLRSIPNFYLRNMCISITRDAIRMQFNCDGTHIVSAQDYDRFLEDNLGVEMEQTV